MIAFAVKWTIKTGCNEKALDGLQLLAQSVAQEPGTLMYLAHTPDSIRFTCTQGDEHESLPTPSTQEVIFIEQCVDEDAFYQHVHGAAFQEFLREYGDLFLFNNRQPFVTIEFPKRQAGFIRPAASARCFMKGGEHANL